MNINYYEEQSEAGSSFDPSANVSQSGKTNSQRLMQIKHAILDFASKRNQYRIERYVVAVRG